MPWTPTLLEDSVDRWLALEPDALGRRALLEILVDLCERRGRIERAVPVPGTELPVFAMGVPEAGVVIVWVIAEKYQQLAIRYLYDVDRDLRFGG